MSYDKYFYGKKLYILLVSRIIYRKQKTKLVYLIPKNNYGHFSETSIYKNFPDRNSKNDDVIKYVPPF